MQRKLPKEAVWQHFSGSGEPAHFYNANGFPSGFYTPLLNLLSQKLKLSTLDMRPSWPDIGPPPKSRYWTVYADDLITFIENRYNEPIIGIGHSMGSTCTILAAEKRPDLFKGLVLIEPAMVSKGMAKLLEWMPKAFVNLFQPAKGTLKKKDTWENRDAYFDYCRNIRGYKRFDEESFRRMAEHGVRETDSGEFTLTFPKIWEAHNYTQAPNVMDEIGKIKIPILAIRGKPSVFFTEALWQEWQRISPNAVFKEDLSYGHLIPLENPERCFKLIEEGLSEIL